MPVVLFENATILESTTRQSKSGNTYCVFRFLDTLNYEVYDLMQFGDSAAVASGLYKGATCMLQFDVMPGREGGARLVLSGVGSVEGVTS